jgi:hypothetical protein
VNTTYSFTTPRRQVQSDLPCIYAVFYNGHPYVSPLGIPAEHETIWGALRHIDQLAAEYATSAKCFRVDRVPL